MQHFRVLAAACVVLILAPSCSSAQKAAETDAEHAKEISVLQGRIQELEAQLKSTNDRVDAMRVLIEGTNPTSSAAAHLESPKPTGIIGHPADGAGARVEPIPSGLDPEGSFVRDQAIQTYRQAMALLDANKYSDAVLAFSSFLERHPDHPLAGAAQYYIGKAYFDQKEYKLADKEFERVLTSYDRSSHITLTLRDLAETEDALKQTGEAAKHRQLLTSLFPQSPAATLSQSAPAPSSPAIERHSDLPPAPPASAPTENSGKHVPSDGPAGGLDEPPSPHPPTAPSHS
jgi:TolA-binding protein